MGGYQPPHLSLAANIDQGFKGKIALKRLNPGPGRRSSVLSRLTRPIPHNLGVDSAGDAVVELSVQLGQLVAGEEQDETRETFQSQKNNLFPVFR